LSDAEFDLLFSLIQERRLKCWADPGQKREGKINRHSGGREDARGSRAMRSGTGTGRPRARPPSTPLPVFLNRSFGARRTSG